MRDARLDLLRVVLILGVVCIHTFCVLDLSAYPHYRTWSLTLNALCHYAVPLFVMLSGIFLMSKCEEPLPMFYKKRLTRILVPLIPAALFFVALRIFRDGDAPVDVLKDLVLGRPYYHLWFAFMLLGVYLYMPFLARLVREVHNGVLATISVLVIYVSGYIGEGPYQIVPYSAYALLGMIIYRRNAQKPSVFEGWCCFVIAFALTALNARMVLKTGSLATIGYCAPLIMVGSVALLDFVLNCISPSVGGITSSKLAALVFGVYLWHPFFKGVAMAILGRVAAFQIWMAFPVTVIAAFGAIYLVSCFRIGAVLLGVKWIWR